MIKWKMQIHKQKLDEKLKLELTQQNENFKKVLKLLKLKKLKLNRNIKYTKPNKNGKKTKNY